MSSFAVTVERLGVHPHPNADALELAQVGEFRAVVRKGQFHDGDLALYIPEQAVLPEELTGELGLTGRLAGPTHNRVKAIRLRGELSQGLVCRPEALSGIDWEQALRERHDFASVLGIEKWVPEIPAHMDGELVSEPSMLAWVDIENLQRYPDIFDAGELVVASEKAHGTACCITYLAEDDRLVVSSKGFATKRLGLVADPNNLYWRAVTGHRLEALCRELAVELGVSRVGLFGEVYGVGVQDLHYGVTSRNEPGFAAFDLAVDDGHGGVRWVDQAQFRSLLDGRCMVVPELYCGPFDFEALRELATGIETLSGSGAHLREGLVVRPQVERDSSVLGGRAIAKLVSSDYLLRKNGTEFE